MWLLIPLCRVCINDPPPSVKGARYYRQKERKKRKKGEKKKKRKEEDSCRATGRLIPGGDFDGGYPFPIGPFGCSAQGKDLDSLQN